MENKIEIPKLNKVYNYFDDGKITESRRDEVIITEIVEFNKIDDEILSWWKEEVADCYWLYAPNTDYFIKGELKEAKQNVIFVRTLNDGWFSLGWWAGRLDLDGELTKILNKGYVHDKNWYRDLVKRELQK